MYEETLRAQEDQRRLARENHSLAEIGRIISSSLDIDDVYTRFSDEVRNLIVYDRIEISMVNQEQGTLVNTYVLGTDVRARQTTAVLSLAGTQVAEVVRTRAPVLLQTEDVEELEGWLPGLRPHFDAGLRSFLMVPLFSKDKVVATLALRSFNLEAFTRQDVDLLQRVGDQIAPALENARLHEPARRGRAHCNRWQTLSGRI